MSLWRSGEPPKCYACAKGLTGEKKECYACRRGLTGQPKDDPREYYPGDDGDWHYDDEWVCECAVWECRCAEVRQTAEQAYCPLCEEWFSGSKHLAHAFPKERERWLANMVTHYRHQHRRSWNKQWRWLEGNREEHVYEAEKRKVNDQAKRQIIRKATWFLIEHGIGPGHFAALSGTEPKTMDLATKRLSGDQPDASEEGGTR